MAVLKRCCNLNNIVCKQLDRIILPSVNPEAISFNLHFLLLQEIEELTKKNKILREQLEELESTKTELYDIIKFHFAKCHSSSE